MTWEFETIKWIVFNIAVVVMIWIDLKIFHKREHEVSVKESLIWSGIWIVIALLYAVFVYWWKGPVPAAEYVTGYIIERSLSIDNIFVFIVIFAYFKVPKLHQHKVLMWGIIGALALRLVLILVGAWLIEQFEWVIYIFGAFLIFTGIKLAFQGESEEDPSKNPAVRLFKKFYRVTDHYHGSKLTIIQHGKRLATPMMVVLVAVAFSDVLFAFDSIPAIFAVTRDPFIVYTANVFAVLGLQAMYFALAAIIDRFHYLKYGLAVVLVFIGVKMLLAHTQWEIPIGVSLAVVAGVLTLSVLISMLLPKHKV
ncbi:TerC family protein [bacterium]|jgi:tellurite resistance protein TerC|nr:TerC family protein [bacterium]